MTPITEITDAVGEEALRVFGRTTASATHELKNALAIIRENAGLLNDYLAMADQGKPVEPARMKTAADRIEAQVLRADGLLKSLNQFAHCVDDSCKDIDLNDIVELFQTLSLRSAAMKQVGLESVCDPSPVMVRTAPFFLLTALAQCLTQVLKVSEPGQTIVLRVAAPPEKTVHFQLSGDFPAAAQGDFPGKQQAELLTRLGATLTTDPDQGRLSIHLKGG